MADLKRRRRAMPEPEDVEDEPVEAAEVDVMVSRTHPSGRPRLVDAEDEEEEQRLEQMFGQANADGERVW